MRLINAQKICGIISRYVFITLALCRVAHNVDSIRWRKRKLVWQPLFYATARTYGKYGLLLLLCRARISPSYTINLSSFSNINSYFIFIFSTQNLSWNAHIRIVNIDVTAFSCFSISKYLCLCHALYVCVPILSAVRRKQINMNFTNKLWKIEKLVDITIFSLLV